MPGTLSARIILGFAVVIVTVAGISAATIINTHRVYREVRVIRVAHLQLALRGRDLAEKQMALVDYIRSDLEGESSAERVGQRLRRFRASRDRLLDEMQQILREVEDPPENHVPTLSRTAASLDEIRDQVAATGPLYDAVLAAPPLATASDSSDPARAAKLEEGRRALAQLRREESSVNNNTRKLEDKHTKLVVQTATGLENGVLQGAPV